MTYLLSYQSALTTALETPWGKADTISTLDNVSDDIITVSTSSHGGMGIKSTVAKEKVSQAAIHHGKLFNGYYWFEEDIDWTILAWELPEYWDRMVPAPDELEPEQRTEHQKRCLLNVLSEWRLDYLLRTDVEPIPEKAQIYKDRRQVDRMRRAKHPDLIVVVNSYDENSVIVGTADGKEYKVAMDSYKTERFKVLFLLSNCVILDGQGRGD